MHASDQRPPRPPSCTVPPFLHSNPRFGVKTGEDWNHPQLPQEDKTVLLTRTETAELLNVSVRTVDRLRISGKLKALRIRGLVRFILDDIKALMARSKEPPTLSFS